MIPFKDFTKQNHSHEISNIIDNFVNFACQNLNIKTYPQIVLVKGTSLAKERMSFGGYIAGIGRIEITIANRHIMDILRTLAHEIVHYKQDLDGVLRDDSGNDGSEHENEANSKAAVIMRMWGKSNPDMFEKAAIIAEQWNKGKLS